MQYKSEQYKINMRGTVYGLYGENEQRSKLRKMEEKILKGEEKGNE